MNWTILIGLTAGALTTLSFIPQLAKIWRTKRAEDISGPTYVIFAGGTFLWLIYGILSKSTPVTCANAITLVFGLMILFLKWKWTPLKEKFHDNHLS